MCVCIIQGSENIGVGGAAADRSQGSHSAVDKIRHFEDFFFSKIIITPLLCPRPVLHECVTTMIFHELLFFLLGGLGGGAPIENLTPIFLFKKKNFF